MWPFVILPVEPLGSVKEKKHSKYGLFIFLLPREGSQAWLGLIITHVYLCQNILLARSFLTEIGRYHHVPWHSEASPYEHEVDLMHAVNTLGQLCLCFAP